MKIFLFVTLCIGGLLLGGCGKPPAIKPAAWQYKVVTIENAAVKNASQDFESNRTNANWTADYDQHEASEGYFNLDTSIEGDSTLNDLGQQGWELVSVVPQTVTMPFVRTQDGTVYNPNTQNLDPNWVKFNNLRTGHLILIFKRLQ